MARIILRKMLKGSLEMLRPIIPRQFRCLSKVAVKHKERLDDKMQAWQIHSYGGLEELKLCSTRMPVITRPSDVLVKVDASSVNPFDLSLTSRSIFSFIFSSQSYFFIPFLRVSSVLEILWKSSTKNNF